MKGLNQIKNTSKQIFNWNVCLLLLALLIFALNQLPFLLDIRPIKYDEAWYLNPAYNLLNGNGLMNDLVGSGGNVNYIGPMLLAGVMALFGQSLLVARLTAVFCGFVAILVLHLILNELNADRRARILTFAIFLSITIINSVFRNVRPEFAVAIFVLIGLLFAIRYSRTHTWLDMAGLSISIYLASCSHPFSLYLFALVGCALLWKIIQNKEWKCIYQLILPILSAALVVITMIYLNKFLNDATDSSGIMHRFSVENALEAMCISMKSVFVRHGVYTIPFLLVNVFSVVKYKEIRWLASINIIFVFTFPIVFSSDLHMVGNSILYFSLGSLVVCGYAINQILCHAKITYKQQILTLCCISLFCLGNYVLSMGYNFHRYEKCNSVLATEIDAIIPDDVLIFGSIRFWPFKMHARWFCEMNRKNEVPNVYDYLIISSQDISSQDELNPKILKNVLETIENYDKVYVRESKQYGLISIYKHKNIIK